MNLILFGNFIPMKLNTVLRHLKWARTWHPRATDHVNPGNAWWWRSDHCDPPWLWHGPPRVPWLDAPCADTSFPHTEEGREHVTNNFQDLLQFPRWVLQEHTKYLLKCPCVPREPRPAWRHSQGTSSMVPKRKHSNSVGAATSSPGNYVQDILRHRQSKAYLASRSAFTSRCNSCSYLSISNHWATSSHREPIPKPRSNISFQPLITDSPDTLAPAGLAKRGKTNFPRPLQNMG